jgi:N-acetylglucosaminyldiphosphoundecaprenol N-acetyl-beta-D-mannosaminyltransferase
MPKSNILGININIQKKLKLIKQVLDFFNSSNSHLIVTLNPEIILKANKDEEYFFTLNHADVATVDGVGVKLASWFIGKNPERLTGVELAKILLKHCQQEKKKVLIINWHEGLSKNLEIDLGLKKIYPNLILKVIDVPRVRNIHPELISKIKEFNSELIMNTLGNPEQEIMLANLKDKIDSAKVLIGIGGTIDYLIGKKKSAPSIFNKLGLEWLWRLYGQPVKDLPIKRRKRIYNATFKFGLTFLKWRFILPFKYRSNVACLLYKKEKGATKIFMVERQDQPGHWQIPQGGLGGLDIKTAGLKELREETGLQNIKYISNTNFIHKYKFPGNIDRHRGAIYRKHTGYKGQKQALLIAEYLGNDGDIKINHWDHSAWKWVDINEVLDIVHELRRESMKKYLKTLNKFI